MQTKFYPVAVAAILLMHAAAALIAAAADDDLAQLGTGFEMAAPGNFEQVSTELGKWKSIAGPSVIDDQHAKTGKQCLWLPGPRSVVELEVASDVSSGHQLTFAAERWTARGPFSFRIEKQTGSTWTEIYNGDDRIRVGRRFLSNVAVAIGDPGARRLRFIVTSPPGTGVLIDDVAVGKTEPQTIAGVQVIPATFPVLVGNAASPLVKLRIETRGNSDPIHVKRLEMTLRGTTDLSDIDSVQLIYTGQSDTFVWDESAAASDPIKVTQETLTLEHQEAFCTLNEGVNFLWIACRLKPTANIDHRVGASCKAITFSNNETFRLESDTISQRMGVAVRSGGDGGVHTYRIPGLITTSRGTLIAVYDVRHRSGGDLPGDIDVGMSRSVDGGRVWEPMKIIMDMGNDPAHRYDGIGDPAILVDRVTGTIWVAALWSHGDRAWNGSGPGLTPDETGQLMLARSDDDGVTWSAPINITSQVKDPKWCLVLQGPGKGITMRDGTLVFAAQYQDPPENKRLPHSTIIWSGDHGKTWQVGTGAFPDTTEAQVVESQPGVLMLNCRYNRAASRVVMITKDLGKTWQQHPTSEGSLIEPGACMASLIDIGRETDTENQWLLFSNPDSTAHRHRITIKGSPDRGLSWPQRHQLLLDEGRGAGYSCMTMIDDQTIGIIYEGSQSDMTFQRISVDNIINSEL